MSTHVSTLPRSGSWAMPAWLMAALIQVGTATLGPLLGGLSRPVFVLACGLIGWLSRRRGPAKKGELG